MTPRVRLHRRLVLTAVLVTSAAFWVWSAAQEQRADGFRVAALGFCVIAGVLWAVAFWRGDWRPGEDYGRLSASILGLLILTCAGPSLVSELVLTHRGTQVEVEVATTPLFEDEYTVVLPGGVTPLRGTLRTDYDFDRGERFTAAVDRGRFVRPMPAEEVNPALSTLFVLAGTGILAITVLAFGFPLGPLRRLSGG